MTRMRTPFWRARSIRRVGLACSLVVLVAGGCSREPTTTSPVASPRTPDERPGTPDEQDAPRFEADIAPAVQPAGLSMTRTVHTDDGRERTYRLYVPESLPIEHAAPLLIGLHGGTGWAEQFEENSRFDHLAEANGFIVAYPDGIGAAGTGALRTWNGGYCCGPAARNNVDDVAFVRAMLQEIERDYRIDPDSVFAAGHSNGGIMAYRLACELSDRIAAVGVVAGSLGIERCEPEHPVSLLHIHGTADRNHPIDGGRGEGISGVSFRPAIDGVRRFVEANGCRPAAVVNRDGDVEVQRWLGCRDGTEVAFVTIDGASHAWPGSDPRSFSARHLVGEPYAGYDASAHLWAFFAAHARQR
jgi:polyhydroxybutyrate depolymerase